MTLAHGCQVGAESSHVRLEAVVVTKGARHDPRASEVASARLERSDRRGTFSRPAGLSEPIRADPRRNPAGISTQEIALAPEPLLTFTCPKTKKRTPTRVEADARTLRASWKSRLLVKCPSCGGLHEISVRDAYLNGAVDAVGRADGQPGRRKGKP